MKKNIAPVLGLLLVFSCTNNNDYDAAGYFEATEITVSAEANGRLLEFNITEGDTIEEGQSVGIIDTTQLNFTKLQLIKNSKAVASNRPDIEKQIAATRLQIENNKKEHIRVEKLVKAGAANAKQLDDIDAATAVLESQLEAQKTLLRNSAASVDSQSSAIEIQIAAIEDQLQKCRLKAPAGGTVLNTFVEKGEFAAVGRPLYKVADLGTMYLRTYFTSEQIADLQLGGSVKVIANFGGDKTREYEGKIVSIAVKSEFTPQNIPTKNERADLVYAVKIKVKNDGYIKIGTYGEVLCGQ